VTIAGPEIARAAADLDLSTARVYAIPMTARFRGITVREGLLIQGPAGWGEFCPFAEYDDVVAASWLATAVEAAVLGWPAPVRDRIPINATVPVVSPERAHQIVTASGCRTAHTDPDEANIAKLNILTDALRDADPAHKLEVYRSVESPRSALVACLQLAEEVLQ
jgi:O-succinylbenzoate synthase